MKRLVFFVSILMFTSVSKGQPSTFNIVYPNMNYCKSILELDNQYIIGHSAVGFDLEIIDTLGNSVASKSYTTPFTGLLAKARMNSKHEIMLMGWSFWYDSVISGNYKAWIVIADKNGDSLRSFFVVGPNVLFNRVLDGIYSNNAYYFIGWDYDSTLTSYESKVFVAKTDTLGNLIWYKRDFAQKYSWPNQKMSIESSYDGKSLFIGGIYRDTTLPNNITYSSYLLNQLDTDGHFIQRITLPDFTSLFGGNCYNSINSISKVNGNMYMAVGNNDIFFLDSNLSIVQRDTNLTEYIIANVGYKNPFEDSYIVGGYKGFMKFYNGDTLFTRTFEDEPDIVSLNDVIPTQDGGYIGVILNLQTGVRVIKMDCDGHYVNPKWCAPLLVNDTEEQQKDWSIYPNPGNDILHITNQSGKRKDLFDGAGQLLISG